MLDILIQDGQISGLGMLIIVAIIFIIFIAIKSLGAPAERKKKSAKKADAPTEAPAPEVSPAPVAAPAKADDAELIAVLAAAISAYCGEPVTKFRVVSFKRIK